MEVFIVLVQVEQQPVRSREAFDGNRNVRLNALTDFQIERRVTERTVNFDCIEYGYVLTVGRLPDHQETLPFVATSRELLQLADTVTCELPHIRHKFFDGREVTNVQECSCNRYLVNCHCTRRSPDVITE